MAELPRFGFMLPAVLTGVLGIGMLETSQADAYSVSGNMHEGLRGLTVTLISWLFLISYLIFAKMSLMSPFFNFE